jgi:hypothetical protein
MKGKTINWYAVVILAIALAFPLALVLKGQGRRHPHIRAAMRALGEANGQLQSAAHDFGGHRVRAMRLIEDAQGQLRQAVMYANHH